MSYTNNKTLKRVIAMVFVVIMMISTIPTNVFAFVDSYADVTTLTGGTVNNNDTANVEVIVEETTLQWVEANSLRAEGWWVGVEVKAPEGFSADATYKSKGNPADEYSAAKNFADMKDGEDFIQLWFPVSPESLVKFANEGRNITMMYTFDWDADDTYEQELTFSVVPSESIVLMKGTEQVYPVIDKYADVTTFTGGTVNNNDTANVEVIVEETTLQWVEANSLRDEGWWVGVEVKAPEGFSADATYKSKGNPADEYSAAKNFADMKDGEDFIQLWFPVSPESLVKFANEGRNITMMYTFDWDADDTYEQELTFSVVPSESIVLMKGTEQVYPVIDKYADVTTLTGGTVNNNDTANVEVVVEETTLQWVEANSLRAEGWWVGVEVKAPEGFSADATYKSKGNPADEYSAAKNFADMKDGEDFIQLWFPVSPESLVKFANEGRNITMMYTFDWDTDDTYEQELTFSVVPSESIVLMKGTEQVYPVITYEVSVEKNGSGTVKINNAENTTTFVERNSDVVVTVVAAEGYQISSVNIGGEDVVVPDASTEFTTTIETIKADTEIDVVFVKVYTATVTHNGTGTGVSNPENGGSVTVETGETIIVTATPDEGNRVVMVTINGVEDTTVSKENDSDYSYSISAEDDYEFVITFAPNVYDITLSAASNGTAESTDVSVEYDKNTTVYLTPDDGYTVDEVYVNGTKCDDIIVDNTGIYFNISNIKSEINVTATFKEIATASLSDVVVDKSEVLREDETNRLLIIKNGSSVTLSTEKEGMKVYDANGIIGGDEVTQSVTIDFETTVTKIELYYKDADEYYKNWHTVEFGDLSIVVDEGDNVVASLEPTTPANINGYYNSDVIFNVSAEDTGDYSGLDFVEYWITCDGIESTKITLYEYVTEINNTFEDGVSLVVDSTEYNSDDIKVTLHVVDRAGNETTVEKEIKINSTKPTVSLDIEDVAKLDKAQDGYYNGDRTLTITIIDRETTFSETNVLAGLAIKKNGENVVVYASDITWTHIDDTHIGKYTFTGDGHYEWSLSYENLAGLANDGVTAPDDKAIYDFYIDTQAPTDLAITYTPNFVDTLLETITFGFYNAPVIVKIEAVDTLSGVCEFAYSYTAEEGASSVNSGVSNVVISATDIDYDGDKASAIFEIPAQFRGKVEFSATDKAGKTAELTDEDRVVVVDNIAPGVNVIYDNNEAQNGKYYSAPRTATVEIDEANFFQQDIDDGLLVITRTTILNDGTSTEETLDLDFTKSEGDVYTATVDFAQDADYIFEITYTDRSGNTDDEKSTYFTEFTVDTTAPEINVSFDNNSAVNENQFMNPRKATITVVEHNFNENGMVVKVNGNPYAVTWDPVENTADTYYAEVAFEGDEHYTFSVNGVDYANNADNGTQYAEGTIAPEAFTVDETAPTELTVTYETEFIGTLLEGLTFGFYKAPVKVTIEAKDDISGIDYFEYSYVVQDGASDVNEGKESVLVDVDGTTASTTFEIPAQFRGCVSFKATNNAGITSSYNDDRIVVVDNIAPGVTISWNTDDSVANNSKYYKSDRTATIYIDEANFFVKDYEDELLVITRKAVYDDGTEKEEILTPDLTKNGDIYTTAVDFTENADYTFEITYKDRSGNIEEKSTYYTEFTIDKTEPNVYFEELANGNHYQNRTVKVYVEEHNFRAEDFAFKAEAEDVYGNEIDLSSKNYESYFADSNKWTEKEDNLWVAEVLFDIEGHYNVSAEYNDLAGNAQKNDAGDTFCVDSTKPVIEVTYNDDEAEYKNENQFRTNRLASIVITEHNFDAKDIFVKVMKGENGLVEDTEYLEAISFAEYLNDVNNWKAVEGEVDIYTTTIEFEEGHYTFEIGYTDKAGNVNEPVDFAESVAPQEFTVDTTKPTEMKITACVENDESEEISILEYQSVLGLATETVEFDTFFKEEIVVKLSANCDISGIDNLKYQKVTDIETYDQNGTWTPYDDETGIVISPTEKFVIYFRAEDRAGNVEIARSTGVVVDDKEPVGESKAPEIDILPEDPNENDIYKGGVIEGTEERIKVAVDIKVLDPKYIGTESDANGFYSGLNEIKYEIYAEDIDEKEEGTLFKVNTTTAGAKFDDDALAMSWEGKIYIDTVKFNSNNVVVKITAVDNAGNSRTTQTTTGDIKIDSTAPKITVTFDNNSADSGYYYKSSRTATIIVTERNLDTKKVIVSGAQSVSEFVKVEGTGNLDNTEWKATANFISDGSYKFSVSCTDEAGFEASVAPTSFVIDKTLPVVSVSYENNAATNVNYYNDTRTATIAITETNFDANRVSVNITATDDGEVVSAPNVSAWRSQGGQHVATITYSADAYYTFDIEVKDKAGNNAADFAAESFYVDTTPPALEITGVENASANNGSVVPVISYSDTNYDPSEVVITLVGANRGKVELEGKYTSIHNGSVFTFNDFAEEKALDDIYTITASLTDKAGNTSTESITFSVNRFGSTYEISSETNRLVSDYYVQNVTEDIVINEINADKLVDVVVTLNGKTLTKDVDYTVSETGGDGQWMKYTYTVSKELFADEGEYSLVVSSKDMAENDAFSDVKDAAINFVVDRTAPVVTITGMTSGGRYQTDVQTVTVIPTDDGGALNSITVLLVDNDGITISKLVDLSGDDLQEHLANNDGKIEFVINDGLYQNVRVICDDLSVDENGNTNTYDEVFDSVSVSSSALMIFWANKPLRWGTIGGVSFVVLAIAAILVVLKKRKK